MLTKRGITGVKIMTSCIGGSYFVDGVEKNKSATNPITCGRMNPDSFESDDVKSVSSLSPNNKPIWRNNVGRTEQISRHYLALRRIL